MKGTLRILFVEDSEDDVLLVVRKLRKAGYQPIFERVEERQAMRDSLNKKVWDVIICDYSMPQFNAFAALDIMNELQLDIPFLIVSGEIGEQTAVLAMKAGAHDYIMKNDLARLVPAIDRELRELRVRHEKKSTAAALRESEEQYWILIEQAPDGIFILASDATILEVNPSAGEMLGYTNDELVGMNFVSLIPTGDLERMPLQIEEIKSGKSVIIERKLMRKDNEQIFVEISAKSLRDGRLQAFVRNISVRKKAEAALRDSEERYALAALGANDGLWDLNVQTGEIYYSPRWIEMLGLTDTPVRPALDEWFKRVHDDDIDKLRAEFAAHLQGVTPHFENEHRIMHTEGIYRWVLARALATRDSNDIAYRMAGSLTDITERKRAEEQLLHDAFHDALTGLPNRALFLDRLGQVIKRARDKEDYTFSILFIDLDRFKHVNDSLGHTVGDKLLISVSERIKKCLSSRDTVARLGGDEFAVLLDGIEENSTAVRVADSLRSALHSPVILNNHEVFTTASIGIATKRDDYHRAEDYLRDADIALYRAKAAGKDRAITFDSKMHTQAMAILRLETDLRRAYDRQEFLLYYQPIIDLKNASVSGFEALIRWDHPDRGILAPADFLDTAEDTGLLISIDRWGIKEACTQLCKWKKQSELFNDVVMNVNLSSKQFSQIDLETYLRAVLKDLAIGAGYLQLEITESTIMENISSVTSLLLKLKEIGVKLSIDDFGTGYSSLSYLHHFPIDTLKIDRSFLSQREKGANKSEIIYTIITLAHNLGMTVVAEGVEIMEQIKILTEQNCDFAQGYYFSKPMPADRVLTYIETFRMGKFRR